MKRPCTACDGSGTVEEFRTYAGEAYAGEPYEIRCDDCEGSGGTDAECDFCKEDAIAEIDGDYLCQLHADEWCAAEKDCYDPDFARELRDERMREAEGLTETHGDPLQGAVVALNFRMVF